MEDDYERGINKRRKITTVVAVGVLLAIVAVVTAYIVHYVRTLRRISEILSERSRRLSPPQLSDETVAALIRAFQRAALRQETISHQFINPLQNVQRMCSRRAESDASVVEKTFDCLRAVDDAKAQFESPSAYGPPMWFGPSTELNGSSLTEAVKSGTLANWSDAVHDAAQRMVKHTGLEIVEMKRDLIEDVAATLVSCEVGATLSQLLSHDNVT
jgi:hypothetical protein